MLTMLLVLWNGVWDGHFPWTLWAGAAAVVCGAPFPVQVLTMSLFGVTVSELAEFTCLYFLLEFPL
jgi:hypothetical protein